ncbi:hypothetical protein FHX82_002799 [Amycolatopsis bartoniae]|uniref:Uncharacterized protein n=1 Tax=Amycolatopsis bartoniae TaxID=941986 RepID=A0A8H9MDD2_9PSEU|nr:hypothetical protein [Amycolatopsis bartoniae]MBB2935745.1 hypothetical protein [Amycolatopsis bartoniae]TVT05851.1 hypothetical protein FNH07_22520 [Amycolatopsis bartoniae]GHF61592.1 hypothetical protein GCM10017566_38760 [Amycolatopsis bartoniae]
MSEPQLRAALRAREPLAPDPEAVLGGARRKIRRRRMASVAAAVVVTVGGLGVAATTLRPPAEEPRLPVAAPSSAAVSAPDLPFRFDVRGYTLVSWRLDSGGTQADYAATGSVVTITASDTDPDVAEEPNGRTVVHGVAATTGESGSGVSRVSWQVSPGKWLQVRGEGSAPEMAALAEDVVAGPVPAPAELKSLQAPAGLRLVSWDHAAEYDVAQLCPEAADDPLCVTVTVSLVQVPSVSSRPSLRSSAKPSATTAASSPELPKATTQAPAQTEAPVTRRIGAYQVEVTSAATDRSVLTAIAASVVLG